MSNHLFIQLLQKLADEAILIATDIQQSLAGPQPGTSVWKSFRHAMLAIWGEKRLKEKSERLSSIRDELQFHAIVSIKEKVDLEAPRHCLQIRALDDHTQRLINATSMGSEATQKELDSRTEALNQKLEEIRWHSKRQHEETQSLSIQHHREQMNAIQNVQLSYQAGHMDKSKHVSTVIDKIKNALCFSRMTDRWDDIKPAHSKTFEWIYSDSRDNILSSCTFMEWLAGQTGVFWVSGRAGSGKSTLMKFLAADDRTREAFKTWAGDRKLVTANYYFWSQAQDVLQKSLQGFLRGLMYDIIDQCGDYAELLFPDQFIAGRGWTDFPTSHQLKRAFRRLIKADTPPACVALMIDGLDEYEAPEEEHFELARYLKDAARAKHLKIVVSSRPESAFETTFVDCEKLRLHELTRADRTVYVTDHLYEHERFNFLVSQTRSGEKQKRKLVNYAVKESQGIFLWLRLVVAALVEDLDTCATFTELRAILDQFPRGLEELYCHMLRRIPVQRQTKGMQLIQLVRCAVAISKRKVSDSSMTAPPMSALMLSQAHSAYRSIIKIRRKPLLKTEHMDIVERIDHLLRRHCAGLLELKYRAPKTGSREKTQHEHTGSSLEDPEVVFLHKSVVEFLERADAESDLLPMIMSSNHFEACVSLVSCLLYKIKVHPLANTNWHYKWSLVLRIMHAAAFAEMVDLEATKRLLENLDYTMKQMFLEIERTPRNATINTEKGVGHWSSYCPWAQANWYPARQRRDQDLPRGETMLSFVIENGLERFPLDKLSRFEVYGKSFDASSLLVSACRATTLQSMMTGGIRPAVILELLKLGAKPNSYFQHELNNGQILSTTPWLQMLHTLRQLRSISIGGFKQLFDVLLAFLKAGADPEARIHDVKARGCSKSSIYTARELLQQCFTCAASYVLIPFMPFEEAWQACGPLRQLPATQYSRFYLPELAGARSPVSNQTSLSPSEIKQIAEWNTILIKLLEESSLRERPVWRKRAFSVLHKFLCQSSLIGSEELEDR